MTDEEKSLIPQLIELEDKYLEMFEDGFSCFTVVPVKAKIEHLQHCLKNRVAMEDAFPEFYPKLIPGMIYS